MKNLLDDNRFAAAYDLAFRFHKDARNNGCPYMVHPLQVVNTLMRWGIRDIPTLCGGVLHDIYENTEATCFDVSDSCGVVVDAFVECLTYKRYDFPSPYESKHAYIEAVAKKAPQVLMIKIADRLCNLSDFIADKNDNKVVPYLAKAAPLFRAFFTRRNEIEQEFGMIAWVEAKGSINDMCDSILGYDCQDWLSL